MVHGLLRKIFPEPQKRRLATMREEIAAIEFDFDRFVRVLLRIVLRDGVTVAVVTPADSAFGVCNHIEAIEEYIRDNYVPAGQSLVLIEHDPPNNISLDDSFSLVRPQSSA